MSHRTTAAACLLVCILSNPDPSHASRPEFDSSAVAPPAAAAARRPVAAAADPALRALGTVTGRDDRSGVPTFLWANRPPAGSSQAPAPKGGTRPTPEQAARAHLARLAPLYHLDSTDARGAVLQHVHDTGRGGIVVTLRQAVGGVEVFRDEIKLMLNRDLDLLSVSGNIPSRSLAGPGAPAFRLASRRAVAKALDDFTEGRLGEAVLRPGVAAPGGYERFDLAAGAASDSASAPSGPLRARKVMFHLPGALVPAYYIEVMSADAAYSYVISAADGSLLYRHSLTANDTFSYRVWTQGASPYVPADGPQGDAPTPHPTGSPNFYSPPFVAPALRSLQNGPISTNDPWLPPGATLTQGNNVDAYADLSGPDGFSPGDLRATTTGANIFDRTYDPTQAPNVSAAQQMAAVTQLFYDTNFFHDWYYDAGFDETAGNAQSSNLGRGGVEGDPVHAEAQDFAGFNNANMTTPADGGSPRMQMYVWNTGTFSKLTVTSPGAIAGDYVAGTAEFGPQSFTVGGNVVLVNDGAGTTTDGCEAIANSVAGKIALIDRGTCGFVTKVLNAQAAGAIGVLIVDNVASGTPPAMSGAGAVTIPTLSVTLATGNAIKAQLGSGVAATLMRQTLVNRDGTIDNQIVAHEWGHYISNRLIGDANGLTTQQSGGLGEGWGDFHAMLMTVEPGDGTFTGTYALVGYALSSPSIPTNYFYFGIRRYPYSIDMNRNPLTFKHIQNGVALPAGPPLSGNPTGTNNAEVHNTGEVWCTMLWECYAALLRDTGRLTFTQARDRMRDDLVTAYQLTPLQPTLLEARDALLAAAYASDVADYNLFWQAFARRGAGVNAVGPDRYSTDNSGVIESYSVGGDLAFVSASLSDDLYSCDHDGYLDKGEVGHLVVKLENTGATSLSATTATLTSGNSGVTFPNGNVISFPGSAPYGGVSASRLVQLTGAAGLQSLDFQIAFNDPGLLVAGPRLAGLTVYGNADETPSATESVEAANPPWTYAGDPGLLDAPWGRIAIGPESHRFYGPDPGGLADQSLVSPPLHVAGTGNFTFAFQHAHSFEYGPGVNYDGGVIEITDNGGASWADIGASATPGYGGLIFTGADNPLSGRQAYVKSNASYPALDAVTVNLGHAYAGKTVQVRFRIGADQAASAPGWQIDDLQFDNLTSMPFSAVNGDADFCAPLAVGEDVPRELSFAIAGANPVSREARFRFALPAAVRVRLAIYDVTGRRVATVADGEFDAGYHGAVWRAGPDGAAPEAGVYFARMTAGAQALTRTLVVVR